MGVTIEQGQLKWTTGMDTSGFDRGIQKIDKGLGNAENKANGLAGSFKDIGAAVSAYFSAQAIADFTKQIIATSAEFQKFNAVLTNTLGSNALAGSIMGQIQKFAAKTPFGVRELTDAFVKLANQGFVPTGKQMRQLGDLASSTGKSFDQLAEAILDAQTGEYERLKEFGIKAKDAGDQVIFTFKGVATEVDKTSSSIRDYITSLGDAQGVSGSMAAISKTLGGEISNLEDSWDNLLKTIGEGTDGVFKDAISTLSKMLTSATEYVEKINTINKYRLDEEVNPVTGRKTVSLPGSPITSSTNARAENIVQLSQGLKEQNDKFREGAKYIREYAAEFQRLNKERQLAVLGVKNKNFASAIDKEYRDMMGTVKAQAEQIIKDRAKPKDANFGTGKQAGESEAEKQAKRIAEAYKRLDVELQMIDLDKKLSFEDIDEKKISAYENLLKSLLENGFTPASKAVTDTTDKIFYLNQELYKIEGNRLFVELMSKEFENFARKASDAGDTFKKTVEEMESTVDSGTFQKATNPPEIKDWTKETSTSLDKIGLAAYDVSEAFYDWSEALAGVDDDLSYTLGQIGNIAGAVSKAATGIAMGIATGNVVQVATSVISLGAKMFSIGKKTKEMNAAARAEVQKFYDDAKKGEMEYQALLRQRDLDAAKRGKTSYKAITDQLELLKKQSPELEKAYNAIFNTLQNGEYKTGEGYKHGTWFRKAKTWDIMASLAGSDYKNLENLYTQGKLVGDEKTNFEELKKLKTELDAAGLSAEDLQEQLSNLLTGTSASGLADSLTDLFQNGKMAAADFGKSFEEIMRTAITSSFKAKYLEDAMRPFYDELSEALKNGTPTQDQVDRFKADYQKLGEDAAAYWENLKKITGIDLTAGSANETGLTGASIARQLTEETGSELAGLWRGTYDIQKKQFNVLSKMDINLVRSADIASQSLDKLNKIEQNTGYTVAELRNAVTELKAINKNTGGQSARDLGI